MNLTKQYKKSYEEQWCMRFKTRHPEGDAYDGIVVSITSEFMALREEDNFEFDGLQIFPKRSITGYRDNKFDRCCNDILRENGELRTLKVPAWLKKCSTVEKLLRNLMKRDIWPGVEILSDSDTAFYIGPVTRIEEEHWWIRCYDAAGKWEKEYRLTYDEIFRIELDSSYCNNFNAYMRRRPFEK